MKMLLNMKNKVIAAFMQTCINYENINKNKQQ